MLTPRDELSQICVLYNMVSTWRKNSNSLQELIYKVSLAGYQTIEGPIWPGKITYVYSCGSFNLFPLWRYDPEKWRGTYLICDEIGLPLSKSEYMKIEKLLKN